MRNVVKSRRHSGCAIIAQGVAGEDEVAQPGVCINVLREGCGASCLQPLPFQVQPLQSCATCRQSRMLGLPTPLSGRYTSLQRYMRCCT